MFSRRGMMVRRAVAFFLAMTLWFTTFPTGLAAEDDTLKLTYDLAERNPINNTVTATLTVQNAMNGVLDIVDDATSLSVLSSPGDTTTTVTIGENGTYSYTVTDGDGRTANCSFEVSSIWGPPPLAPEVTLSGEMQSGYYKGSATVNITTAEPDITLYYDDGNGRTPYTEPFLVDADGAHSITAIAVGEDGQETLSIPKSFMVKTAWPQLILEGGPFSVFQGIPLELFFLLKNMPGATVTAASSDGIQLPESAIQIVKGEGDGYIVTVTAPLTALGAYSITLTAEDEETITLEVPLTVLETKAPVVYAESMFQMKYDAPLTYDFSAAGVSSDPGGRPLTYSISSPPGTGSADIEEGVLTYTADGTVKMEAITIRVDNGVKHTDVPITIAIYKEPITPEGIQEYTAPEDASKTIDLSDLCSDVFDEELVYTLDSQATHGTATISGSEVTYTPGENYYGPDAFCVMVTHKDSSLYSKRLDFGMTVTPVDDAPVAEDDLGVEVPSNGFIYIDVLANDHAIDDLPLEILDIVTPPGKAQVCEVRDGKIYYKPDPRMSGTDTLEYTVVHQREDKTLFDTATVTMNILEVNDLQTIQLVETPISIVEDTLLTFSFDVTDIDCDDFDDFDITLTSTNPDVFLEGTYSITHTQMDTNTRRYTVQWQPVLYANTEEYGDASIRIAVTDGNDLDMVATTEQEVIVTPFMDGNGMFGAAL